MQKSHINKKKTHIAYVSHAWIGEVEYICNFRTKYFSCSANLQVAGGIVGIIAIQPLYWESKQAHIGRIHLGSVKEWVHKKSRRAVIVTQKVIRGFLNYFFFVSINNLENLLRFFLYMF